MRRSLMLGAASLLLSGGMAAAQTPDGSGAAAMQGEFRGGTQDGGDGQQGTSPREAWQNYMRQRGMDRRGAEAGEARQGGHHGMNRMGPSGQGAGARFMFDRDRGRIFIQCAPSDSTEACARAMIPVIEAVMGPAGKASGESSEPAKR